MRIYCKKILSYFCVLQFFTGFPNGMQPEGEFGGEGSGVHRPAVNIPRFLFPPNFNFQNSANAQPLLLPDISPRLFFGQAIPADLTSVIDDFSNIINATEEPNPEEVDPVEIIVSDKIVYIPQRSALLITGQNEYGNLSAPDAHYTIEAPQKNLELKRVGDADLSLVANQMYAGLLHHQIFGAGYELSELWILHNVKTKTGFPNREELNRTHPELVRHLESWLRAIATNSVNAEFIRVHRPLLPHLSDVFDDYAVEARSLVRGSQLLSECLTEEGIRADVLRQIDRKSVSRLMVSSILLCPGKVEEDSLRLVPNEEGGLSLVFTRSFEGLNPTTIGEVQHGHNRGKHKHIMNNILYLLSPLLDQPVHESIRDLFVNADFIPEIQLIEWLTRVDKYYQGFQEYIQRKELLLLTQQEELEELDEDSEAQELLEKDFESFEEHKIKINGFLAEAGFPAHFKSGVVGQLLERMYRLKTILQNDPHITHRRLLTRMHPVLSHVYSWALRTHNSNVLEAFNHLRINPPVIEEIVGNERIADLGGRKITEILSEEEYKYPVDAPDSLSIEETFSQILDIVTLSDEERDQGEKVLVLNAIAKWFVDHRRE